MVAYGFKAFFAPQIETGVKRQTVRANRKRHARPGEMLQLYQGMRTRHCRKIVPDRPCLDVGRIVIERRRVEIVAIEINGVRLSDDEIEAFARDDGFAPEQLQGAAGLDSIFARYNMGMFWSLAHPGDGIFEGALIRWEPPGAAA
ncbi:MAG TPA: ASCH domain-containing protein [Pseudorhizobium sp.]|nr:ASCH domain-containing protein [Pseudorhizobium sp.]